MKTRSFAFTCVALAVGLSGAVACSSSSNAGSDDSSSGTDSGTDGTTGGGDSGGPKDSGIINDPDNCVKPGTTGNSQGIGGYCSPLGNQCDTAGPGGSARLCTADITGTPAHAWFCTYPCEHTSDCGENAVCYENNEGAGCIPTACLALDADAGGHVIDDDAGDGGDGG